MAAIPRLSEHYYELLACPVCKSSGLSIETKYLRCTKLDCSRRFPLVNGIPILLNDEASIFTCADFENQRETTFRVKGNHRALNVIERHLPRLGNNINSRGNYQQIRRLLLQKTSKPVVLVIGGSILGTGMQALIDDSAIGVIETDVSFGPRTQLICDAHDLPFKSGSLDAVVAQAVIQCLADPGKCVAEIHRVLKHDGLVYAETSFMQQVVNGRYDFNRFTHLGVKQLFRYFEEIKSGIVGGPASALAWSFQFFLLSFSDLRIVRRLARLVSRMGLFWLKYLDYYLVKNRGSYDAASGFYFLGRRGDRLLSSRQLIADYRGVQ